MFKLFKKTKKEIPTPDSHVATPEIEKEVESPKETTRKAVVEITLVNNKTDKEYILKAENDFGLMWEYIGEKDMRYQLLTIQQKNNIDGSLWQAIGRFVDFSVIKVVWKTFDL